MRYARTSPVTRNGSYGVQVSGSLNYEWANKRLTLVFDGMFLPYFAECFL